MVLLMMGQDDSLLSASLNKPAVPSDIDVSSWRNHGSRRPPFLHWDVSERVAVFGHAVSDVLLTPRRHDPSPRRPESPTPLGQPSALGRSEGLRSAEPSASNGATAFSRLCCSARALATPSRVP